MPSELKKLAIEEVKDIASDKLTLKDAQDAGEPIFEMENIVKEEAGALVKIEISLRKCKRVGMFEK